MITLFGYFYLLFDAQFVKNRNGPCNIMIAQQNIDVILSMRNIYKQLLHNQFIIATFINFITRVLLFETK